MSYDESKYRVRGKVVIRHLGDDTLLVPVSGAAAGGRVYPLNKTAEEVWSCLVAGGTPAGAATQLCTRYEVSAEQALNDCRACVRAFVDERLLERIE